jgi:predicted PurR-regulated permease PerM
MPDMADTLHSEDRFRRVFLVMLVLSISAAFLWMVQSFLLTILLAAIFSGLLHPAYRWLLGRLGGRAPLAAALTVLFGLLVIGVPLLTVLGLVTNEAINISEAVTPRVKELVSQPSELQHLLERLPFYDRIAPYRAEIIQRAGELVGNLGRFLVTSLSNTTRGTVSFLFDFFIMLYAMFFLLMDGPELLRTMLRFLPLRDEEKEQMLDKFVSVTRATLRGTLVIGAIQGLLSGIAFWMVGINGALFWGTVMIVLSVLPVVGGALVWVPAAIFLAVTGNWMKAIGLTLFCALIVGSIDNVLRPRLVGRDTKMHDLMILFSTLGGIIAFGPIGFIVGPILAALFLTSWEIFAVAFRDVLPGSSPIVLPDGTPHVADTEGPVVETP